MLLFQTYKRKENFYDSLKNLIKNFKYYYFIISLLPTLSYNGYIRSVLDNKVYDANTQYWGQFVWIFDFIRGKVITKVSGIVLRFPQTLFAILKIT